jgi:hypothetical protein
MIRAFELTFKNAAGRSMKNTVHALTPQLAREIGEAAMKRLPVKLVRVQEVPTVPSQAAIDNLVTVTKKAKRKERKRINPAGVAGLRAWVSTQQDKEMLQ